MCKNIPARIFSHLLHVPTLLLRVSHIYLCVDFAGEYVGNFTSLAGYGSNLRLALNAFNIRIYDERTYRWATFRCCRNETMAQVLSILVRVERHSILSRFDSPYQTGNCGGDGTCGTCVVAVLEGKEMQGLENTELQICYTFVYTISLVDAVGYVEHRCFSKTTCCVFCILYF